MSCKRILKRSNSYLRWVVYYYKKDGVKWHLYNVVSDRKYWI